MRTRGEGGLEKIGHIWYFTFYNLKGKQMRRSSKSRLKSVELKCSNRRKKIYGKEPSRRRRVR